MRKPNTLAYIAIFVLVFAAAFVYGCTGDQSTIDEPEDISVEYLSEDYAEQLVRDGATVIFGVIDIREAEDGTLLVVVGEREFVRDENQLGGFYIADTNLESVYPLSPDTRATFLPGGSSVAEAIESADEFADAVWVDFYEYGNGSAEYQEKKLYDIYVIGEQIELLIARQMP